MNKRIKNIAVALSLTACLILSACAQSTGETSSGQTLDSTAASSDQSQTTASGTETTLDSQIDSTDQFTDRDYETEADSAVNIKLADQASTADGSGVTIDNNTVTITAEGSYHLSGTLTNGQIVVETADTAKVQLILDGVTVSQTGSAAIYIKSADKVFITLAAQSENQLSSSGEFVQTDDNTVDAAIFAKSDLTLNGSGSLTVTSETGHGIVSKDDLKVTGGSYSVTAAGQGLSGKDSVRIADGTFKLNTQKDGIHAENSDDSSLGYVYIKAGEFTIAAEGDGISASSELMIENGDFDISAGTTGTTAQTSDSSDSSQKGLKATTDLLISGG
ncbi:MAG: carbohydrate-binding domain-containing protein, partial [Oscillospiraceae bacterium]|nr:carbohydrate-binding domain-containing protein [Oscillospiraceae bacterium]